jgi:TM2 domain-containing membrane protein YozV
MGSIFCEHHVPAAAAAPAPAASASSSPATPASPYTAPASASRPEDYHATNPALAFLLGFIPGVGAIYNGQYAKGLIHVVVFGILVTVVHGPYTTLRPLVGLMIAAWIFYMAFEAYHTARKRRYGLAVEEFSSLLEPPSGRFPAGAVLLIALGFVLLLDTTGVIPIYEVERYWPVGLIVLGVYLLFTRVNAADRQAHGSDRGADGAWSRR